MSTNMFPSLGSTSQPNKPFTFVTSASTPLFGQSATTASTGIAGAPTTTGFTFGAKPSEAPASTNASLGFMFGAKPDTAPTSTATTGSGFSFGMQPAATTTVTSFTFGQAAVIAATSTAAPVAGSLFGTNPAATALSFTLPKLTAATSATPATTNTGISSGFVFGTKSDAAPATTGLGLSFGVKPDSTATLAAPTATPATSFTLGQATAGLTASSIAISATPLAATTSFTFGAKPADATTTTGISSSGFMFGANAKPDAAPAPDATTGLGLSFGVKPAATTTTPATGFTLGVANAGSNAASTAPVAGFTFGQSTTGLTVTSTASSGTGFTFGQSGSALTGTYAAAPTPPSGSLFGTTTTTIAPSFSTSKPATATSAFQNVVKPVEPAMTTTNVSGATTGSMFGATSDTSANVAPTGLGAISSFGIKPVATIATGFTFGGQITGSSATTNTATIAPSFSTPKLTPTTSAVATTAPALSTSSTIATSLTNHANQLEAKPLTYEKLEEMVNNWTLDVEEQEKIFMAQATQINYVDRVIMANADKIVELGETVENLEQEHSKIEHELDFAGQQQLELGQILDQLENFLNTSVHDDTSLNATPAYHGAAQREQMVQLQIQLDNQMAQIGRELETVAEKVDVQTNSSVGESVLKQIPQVLAKQMDALQWISDQTSMLKTQVLNVKRGLDNSSRDKSFSADISGRFRI